MRVLVVVGMCDEVGENQYRANEVTEIVNGPGGSGGERHQYVGPHCAVASGRRLTLIPLSSFDLLFPVGARLVEDIRQSALDRFPMMPGQISMFQYTHGMPTWEWYKRHPVDGQAFNKYMTWRRQGMLAHWHDIFPAASRLREGLRSDPDAVLLVDVGGGHGHDLESFQKRHSDMFGRLVLEDLPAVVDTIDRPLPGIERISYDFFNPQPIHGEMLLARPCNWGRRR